MLKVRKMRGYVNTILVLGVLAFISLYSFTGVSFVAMLNLYIWLLCTLFNGMLVKASRYRGVRGFIRFALRYLDIYVSIIFIGVIFSVVYFVLM